MIKGILQIFFLVIFFISLPQSLLAQEEIVKDKWIKVKSKNFNVVSNAGEKDTKNLVVKLEQFRYVTASIVGTEKIKTLPLTVYVFKDSKSFTPFKGIYKNSSANFVGYFINGIDEKLIALDASNKDLHTIFHEYTHLLTSLTKTELPVWLEEGIADFYANFEIRKTNEVLFGAAVSNYIYLLRDNKLIPLHDFFTIDRRSTYYNEKNTSTIFYAQSWALVHYLSQGTRRQQYVQFVSLLANNINFEQAFQQAFNTDYITIEKELSNYIKQNELPALLYSYSTNDFEKETTTQVMAKSEVVGYLGKLLLNNREFSEAEKYFNSVIAIDKKNPTAYEGLAQINIFSYKKYSEAKDLAKQAISLETQNGYAYYMHALCSYREIFGEKISFNITDKEKLKQINDLQESLFNELKTSIKLLPEFINAYYLLGVVSLNTEKDLKETLQLMQMAKQLEPQNKSFIFLQAVFLIKLKDYQSAKSLITPLLAENNNPEVKSQAEGFIKDIDAYIAAVNSNKNKPADTINAKNLGKITPPKIISKENPIYTEEARKEKVEGIIILSALLCKDGVVRDLKVVKSLGNGLDEEALKAAEKIKFTPAEKDGQPVDLRVRLEFTFNLIDDLSLLFSSSEVTIKQGESKKLRVVISRSEKVKGDVTIKLDKPIAGIDVNPISLSTSDKQIEFEIIVGKEVKVDKYTLSFSLKDQENITSSTKLTINVQ